MGEALQAFLRGASGAITGFQQGRERQRLEEREDEAFDLQREESRMRLAQLGLLLRQREFELGRAQQMAPLEQEQLLQQVALLDAQIARTRNEVVADQRAMEFAREQFEEEKRRNRAFEGLQREKFEFDKELAGQEQGPDIASIRKGFENEIDILMGLREEAESDARVQLDRLINQRLTLLSQINNAQLQGGPLSESVEERAAAQTPTVSQKAAQERARTLRNQPEARPVFEDVRFQRVSPEQSTGQILSNFLGTFGRGAANLGSSLGRAALPDKSIGFTFDPLKNIAINPQTGQPFNIPDLTPEQRTKAEQMGIIRIPQGQELAEAERQRAGVVGNILRGLGPTAGEVDAAEQLMDLLFPNRRR